LGERLIGRRHAWLTPAMTLLASGMPLACKNRGPSLLPNMISECKVDHWSANGPVASYFFQHPWALGIPMAVAAILLFTERAPRNEKVRLRVLAFFLRVLSFSELVLFVTVVPSMIVAELYYEDRLELRRALPIVAAAAGAGVLAKLLGGFLLRGDDQQGLKF